MDMEQIMKCVNKYGFACVMSGMFLYNSYDTNKRLDKITNDYLLSQKEDRDKYIEVLGSQIETIGKLNTSVDLMAQHMKAIDLRMNDLEKEVRYNKNNNVNTNNIKIEK